MLLSLWNGMESYAVIKVDDESLIALVSENECLYNKRNRFYTVEEKKAEVWRAIALELGLSEEICRKRWIALRQRFSREYRKSNAPHKPGYREWHLLQHMEFLEKHIVGRPGRQIRSIYKPLIPDQLKTLTCQSPSQSSHLPIALKPQQQETIDKNVSQEPVNDTLRVSQEPVIDTLRGFGIMMLGIIGSMSERKQLIAMQRITDIITNLKLEAEDSDSSQFSS